VLNFFEFLGRLVRTGVIERDDAWFMFSDWDLYYWPAAEPCVQAERARNDNDTTLWQDCQRLYQDMIKVEKQHRGPKVDVTRNAEEIDQFLATESAARSYPE
jgi:hypothetical protein